MQAFVVTGASGFIGKSLCTFLADTDCDVIAVSRDPKFRFPDRRIKSVVLDALPNLSEAVCIHLAGSNSTQAVEGRYDEHFKEASVLTERILSCRFKKIVFVSSAGVYDDRSPNPCLETSPLRPRSDYGRLKMALETMFSSENCVIARISNVYGPGMPKENVLSGILRQLQTGSHVHMRNLTAIRDYVFISDAAKALARLVQSNLSGVYNVSTGKGTRVDELISLLAGILNKTDVTADAAPSNGAASILILSSEKIAKDLGWKPTIELRQGLESMIHQYR